MPVNVWRILALDLVLIVSPCDTIAQSVLTRFVAVAGSENEIHDVDPDFGNQREWFRLDPTTWALRYPDGYVTVFTVQGSSTVGGKSVQTLISSAGSTQYGLPMPVTPGSPLYFRNNASATFQPASTIAAFLMDSNTSGLSSVVQTSLIPVRDQIFGAIPSRITENGSPDADKLRWQFDAYTDAAHRLFQLVNGRIAIAQVYHGDIETKQTFGGCHLNPVFVEANLAFTPQIVSDSGKWLISASSPDISFTTLPGTDTGCSIFNINISSKMSDYLNGDNLKQLALNALKKAQVAVPIQTLWDDLKGPFTRDIGSGNVVCVYPNVSAFWVGSIIGTNISAVSIPISLKASPRMVVSSACAPAAGTTPTAFDGSMGLPSQLVSDVMVPYDTIKNAILSNANVKNDGFTDLQIEPHQAYMKMTLHRTDGSTVNLNAVPIIPIPLDQGDISVQLVFSKVDGAVSGPEMSDLQASYSQDLKSTVKEFHDRLVGDYKSGSLDFKVLDASWKEVSIVCAPEGLHDFVTMSFVTTSTLVVQP